MPKTTKRELEKKSRGELVRTCEGAGLPYAGTNEQLVSRLAEAQAEKEAQPAKPSQEQ